MYYDREDTSRRLVELEIANLEELLPKLDAVLEVAKRFDGKVYNRKFPNAIFEEVSSWMYCEVNGDYFEIDYHPQTTYIKVGEYSNANLKRNYILVMYENLENIFNIGENGNKRISYEKIRAAIEKCRDKIEGQINEDRNGLAEVEKWKEYISRIQKMADAVNKMIPYDIKEYFDLDYVYRRR